MSLTPGTRLGVYEITTLIGAGGMGEVYRARDTKLNRDIAIKVLPEQGLTFGTLAPLPIEGTIHPISQRNYDVTPDGKQLIVVLAAQTTASESSRRTSAQINVVLNWFEELRARAPLQ